MSLFKQAILASAVIGIAIGVGAYTFVYAEGGSYLTNDPAACANCHIMSEHYAAWTKSSHRAVAVCNDCHTPKGPIAKYATKASNGFWHSFAFTTGRFPDPLTIKGYNRDVAEGSCRNCHRSIAASIADTVHVPPPGAGIGSERDDAGGTCTRCHRSVGHWVR